MIKTKRKLQDVHDDEQQERKRAHSTTKRGKSGN